jgi:DNA polymerase-3 subunit epsilon
MARVLTASGVYHVLRRFEPRCRYTEDDGAPKRIALFVDTETTGLYPARDHIIELAVVPFQYGVSDGRVYAVHEPVAYLEDPGFPIPPEIADLTGITTEMVRGQRINDDHITALAASASLIIAHNAAFDRQMLEPRLPVFASKPWACSHMEVPWHTFGCRGTKLEFILFKRCGEFFEGHRASDDCLAGIHILATPFPCGTIPLQLLLNAARAPTVRVWAPGTPYALRDVLKSRRYRWHPGDTRRAKSWYRDGTSAEAEIEGAWLTAEAYPGRAPLWTIEQFTARDRYSSRMSASARLRPHGGSLSGLE